MQNGIIAGNGSSRYLKTVSAALSLYPDYESFMAALIAGTFPIDLNGINADGWTQQGTPLNKANLLSDSTARLLGLDASGTPNTAFVKLKSLIDVALADKLVFGSFQTKGDNSQTSPYTINLGFEPKLVFIFNLSNNASDSEVPTVYSYGHQTSMIKVIAKEYSFDTAYITSNGFYVQLYSNNVFSLQYVAFK